MSRTAKTLFALLFLIALAGVGFWYNRRASLSWEVAPEKSSQSQETRDLLAKLSLLTTLPTDEVPTIATVTNPDQLKGQAFFEKAKIGDKVIIYTKAKKAILYDPIANKIIEVAPLNL